MRTPEFIGSFWREAMLSRFFEVKTVLNLRQFDNTPLKRGVNERLRTIVTLAHLPTPSSQALALECRSSFGIPNNP